MTGKMQLSGRIRKKRLVRGRSLKVVRYCLLMMFLFVCAAVLVRWTQKLEEQTILFEKMRKQCSTEEVKNLLREMKCFPVRRDSLGRETCYFDNGYGDARSYGGKRRHEGIDIMASNNKAGYFQIQSVSDGVVEQMGWLPLGGYRIGVRSSTGFYYYYAHMEEYADGIKIGKKVSCGDILGTMGNTGYGEEGTRGKFAVHLHFGIYRQVKGKEKSLNPFYFLENLADAMENGRLTYGNTIVEGDIGAVSACCG